MATLEPLDGGLFLCDGPVVRDMGMYFDTRMSVVKLGDGSVWIASPVPVPFATLQDIAGIGPIRYLVSPTPRHFWRLGLWHGLFPEAELWASPVTLKKGGLPLAGIIDGPRQGPWAGDLEHIMMRGSRLVNEVVFFHSASGTVLIEDVIQIHQPQPGRVLRNSLIALGGVGAPWGGTARDIRLTFRNKAAAKESAERILAWDFETLVVAHGPVIKHAARETVERAFAWLLD